MMLFWGLGILNMIALYIAGGPTASTIGGCYTIIIFVCARCLAEKEGMTVED